MGLGMGMAVGRGEGVGGGEREACEFCTYIDLLFGFVDSDYCNCTVYIHACTPRPGTTDAGWLCVSGRSTTCTYARGGVRFGFWIDGGRLR